MKKLSQKELIMMFVRENGFIMPAQQANKEWRGNWFGSELRRRCCELAEDGKLQRIPGGGKYVKFILPRVGPEFGYKPTWKEREEQKKKNADARRLQKEYEQDLMEKSLVPML